MAVPPRHATIGVTQAGSDNKTVSGAVHSFLTVLLFLAGVVLGGLLRARCFLRRSFFYDCLIGDSMTKDDPSRGRIVAAPPIWWKGVVIVIFFFGFDASTSASLCHHRLSMTIQQVGHSLQIRKQRTAIGKKPQ
jgi:hypothetical protein